jgi:hypothetical protein
MPLAAGEHLAAQQPRPGVARYAVGAAVGDQLHRLPGVEHDLSRQRVQRAHLDLVGGRHQPPQACADPRHQLGGRIAVEGDDADPVRGHAVGEQDPEPRDQRRRLAAARRGDDLGRPVGHESRPALLGVERREQAVSRRCCHAWRDGDRSRMADSAYSAINDRLPSAWPVPACWRFDEESNTRMDRRWRIAGGAFGDALGPPRTIRTAPRLWRGRALG